MTMAEFSVWHAYRSKYGPMNPVRMYDAGPAIVASVVNNAHGGKATAYDFMPYSKKEQDQEVDAETFVEMLEARNAKRR